MSFAPVKEIAEISSPFFGQDWNQNGNMCEWLFWECKSEHRNYYTKHNIFK